MSTYWISVAIRLGIVALVGAVGALTVRGRFRVGFFAAGLGAIVVRRVLTRIGRVYLDVGDLVPALTWDWGARLLALVGTLAMIAAIRDATARDAGLTLRQRPGSLRTAIPVALGLLAVGLVIQVIVWPGNVWTPEELAYQATMPGIEEQIFYFGLLLLLFDRAYGTPWRVAGVEIGWGSLLPVLLFGLVHGLSWRADGARFDWFNTVRTAALGLGFLWLRKRTGSVAVPILTHNLGNTLRLFV